MRSLRASLTRLCACGARRHSSSRAAYNAGLWLNRRQYGDEAAPVMGSRGNPFSDEALGTRQLYCKALVYASGATRLSRDWIAGSAALMCPHQVLLTIALQYNACDADVAALRQHFLSLWLAQEPAAGVAAEDPTAALDPNSPDDVRAAEATVLAQLPEVRCFLYDAMTASLFYMTADAELLDETRCRVMEIGAAHFGLTAPDMEPIWRVVQEEANIKKNKIRALGQPRSAE
ncbi:hypothetical protein STCU_01733 [Strigomonas culicis]|uniref:Uncharacterized protein n=1 Tax=Strigomonas culicis TaxID=28005 RepID=S9UZN4_9TRYP|nr:hypothetical protein STCU_01733 [Strigomonas culicis]|eukprot:EPY34238.1 hypothetical protein STCU_01733 [Strigomonas culicis]